MEEMVSELLIKENISFSYQKTFDWLKYEKNLFIDFYLPDYNIAIECQGEQHFKPVDYFGGDDGFEKTKQRDKIKKQLCEEHNIEVVYILNKDELKTKFLDKLMSIK